MFHTKLSISDGLFYINDKPANDRYPLMHGLLAGIYSDKCLYSGPSENILFKNESNDFGNRLFESGQNTAEFFDNLPGWRKSGVDIFTVGMQNKDIISVEDEKSHKHKHSKGAYQKNGILDETFMEKLESLLIFADQMGFIVQVNLLDLRCIGNFNDEYCVHEGLYNILDWFAVKNFSNVLLNITNPLGYSKIKTFLEGEKIYNLLKSIKSQYKNYFYIGTGIKNEHINTNDLSIYIENSDFVPIYLRNRHNTKQMLEIIYFYKQKQLELGRKIPLIITKGDNFSDKFNTYGENNMQASIGAGVSWCYYDEGKPDYKSGFDTLPINWDINSDKNKKRFYKNLMKLKSEDKDF